MDQDKYKEYHVIGGYKMLKFLKRVVSKSDCISPEINDKANIFELNEQESIDSSNLEPLIEKDKVSIFDVRVSPANGELLVGFFINNGSSRSVKFSNVPLVLMDSERRVLARQTFDGDIIGEIADNSTKVCVVRFNQSNIYNQEIPKGCQICFDAANNFEQIQIRYQSLPDNLTEIQQQELVGVLEKLPPMRRGEINFSPLYAQITPQNDLQTTVIIRNSMDKSLDLEQLPLAVFDAQHKELARGQFNISDLTIEPFKAILWTFNFGPVRQSQNMDLRNWSIGGIQ